MKRWILITTLVAVGLAGCNKKKEEPKEEPKAELEKKPEPAQAKKPKAKKKPKYDGLTSNSPKTKLDIPTVAELEEEAAKKIEPENLESELDRLEAQIVGVPN